MNSFFFKKKDDSMVDNISKYGIMKDGELIDSSWSSEAIIDHYAQIKDKKNCFIVEVEK